VRRALWVTAIPPCFTAGGGGEIRQAHLLDALADRFEVSLILAGKLSDERVRSRLRSVTEVSVGLDRDPPSRWRRRIRDVRWLVMQRRSDEVARHANVRRLLAPLAAADPAADVVCVEYIGLAEILPRDHRGFWTLTLHNLTSVMARHSAAIAPGRRQRLMLGFEERNARRVEEWAIRAYDLVAVPSAEDAAQLLPGAAVVPNGVDAERFRPSPLPDAPRVMFTGALHTLPNRDGICWFCQAVWPAIRASVPEAVLEIVGARPPAEILELGEIEGVVVRPDVPDVVPFHERARVAVVPLRIGTGSRLKALEAMAAGRPVVGTTIGVGGIEVQDGREVIVADQPSDFAAAVIRCLSEDELPRALAAHGRSLVERRYSWKRIGADYATLLEERSAARDGSVSSTRLETSSTN
jgi:glycosyltransferase involved in cell wall biosynthesis